MARRRALGLPAPTRFPAVYVSRLLFILVILGVVLVLMAVVAGGFLTYGIISKHNDNEVVTPESYLLSSYEKLSFTDRSGGEHEGWLLIGNKGFPVIVLCHGYNSNRSDLLSLGMALRDNHFNAYLFNFRPAKARESVSALGFGEATVLLDGIAAVAKHASVNPRKVGLYGTTLGGYAALLAAEQSPVVKAVVVDTVYDSPDELFESEVDRRLGGSSVAFRVLAEKEFHLFTMGSKRPQVSENLAKLANIPKLFISGRDLPSLAAVTENLYTRAPQPKRLLIFEHSQTGSAVGGEKNEYELQVLSFFQENLLRSN